MNIIKTHFIGHTVGGEISSKFYKIKREKAFDKVGSKYILNGAWWEKMGKSVKEAGG